MWSHVSSWVWLTAGLKSHLQVTDGIKTWRWRSGQNQDTVRNWHRSMTNLSEGISLTPHLRSHQRTGTPNIKGWRLYTDGRGSKTSPTFSLWFIILFCQGFKKLIRFLFTDVKRKSDQCDSNFGLVLGFDLCSIVFWHLTVWEDQTPKSCNYCVEYWTNIPGDSTISNTNASRYSSVSTFSYSSTSSPDGT